MKQLSGEYDIHSPKMRTLWRQAVRLKGKFRKASFFHVSRVNRYISRVDELANLALDRVAKTLPEFEGEKAKYHQLQLNDQAKEERRKHKRHL